jgi:hypothetical protein
MDPLSAYGSIAAEIAELLPPDALVVDAHTHLGRDEDGQALDLSGLIASLDEVSQTARACTFPLHDPERAPAYRAWGSAPVMVRGRPPAERRLAWAG